MCYLCGFPFVDGDETTLILSVPCHKSCAAYWSHPEEDGLEELLSEIDYQEYMSL